MTSLHMQAFNITILRSIAFSLDARLVDVFVFHCNLSAFASLSQHSRIFGHCVCVLFSGEKFTTR